MPSKSRFLGLGFLTSPLTYFLFLNLNFYPNKILHYFRLGNIHQTRMSFCFCQFNPYSGDPLPPLAIPIFESDMTRYISSAADQSDAPPTDQDILTLKTADDINPVRST